MNDPITLLLIGIGVVIASILWLRLHAFLALALAALVVGFLTPKAHLLRHGMDSTGFRPDGNASAQGDVVAFLIPQKKKSSIREGMHLVAKRMDATATEALLVGELEVKRIFKDGKRRIAEAEVLRLEPGYALRKTDVLLTEAADLASAANAKKSAGTLVAAGFGLTCAKVGIIIAMAAIIGTCLLESGAADRIVRSALHLCGEKRSPYALSASSFVLGIPVFFDTVFYLMIPLAKALASRTGRNYLLYVLAIIAGGSMTHSLVPPTPGPLLVAGELGVDVGQMIIGGLTVGIFGMIGGFIYAHWANKRWPMEVRAGSDVTTEDLKAMAARSDDELPNLWLSLAPILLPVILIAGHSIMKQVIGSEPTVDQKEWLSLTSVLGDKNLALTLGAGLSLWLLAKSGLKKGKELTAAVRKSLGSAGSIILITGMGGAFGGILQQTGIGSEVSAWVEESGMGLTGLLLVAFFVTVVIRIAQGSATVAMITAVGIVGGMVDPGGSYWIGYVALAIGCGAKPFPWMNDSGFWVVGRLAGFTEGETLKTFSCIISLLGIVGIIVTILLANLWPNFIF
ncbi:MAG: gluconate transporter [Opitutales bacterium]|nr:gluconate transporter [Opitutales bacterium]